MIKIVLDLKCHQQKLLVDLSYDQQPTILSFLRRILEISSNTELRAENLELYDKEYILPHLLSSKYIKTDEKYIVREKLLAKKEIKNEKRNAKEKEIQTKKKFVKDSPEKMSSESESESD